MEATALREGPGGRPWYPAGLTWRLCSAASSSRCRFAQTSRCSGKVGPGPAMLGLSAASRAGVAGVPRSRLSLGPAAAPSPPVRAAPELCPTQPGSPRAPAAVAAAAAAQAAGRAGREGGAAPGRGIGPRAPSPPTVMATATGPARAGGGRGALPSLHGNHAHQGRS